MLALSLPGQLETVGSIAGFAAILGLAVLSVLYFAQAREVKRLREYLEDAGERAVGAPQAATAAGAGAVRKVAPAPVAGAPPARSMPQPQTQAPPKVQPAGAAAAAVPAPAARGMAAPAGMGAPALASATRFGGLAAATAAAVATPEQREGAEAATQPPTKAAPEPAALSAPDAEPATQAVPALTPAAATPAAARAGGQGNGRSDRPVAPPPVRPPARPAARPAASRTMPPSRGARPASAPPQAPPRRRSWVTAALTVLALVLLAGIAFAAIQFVSGGNDDNGPTASAPAKSTTGTKRKQGASFSNGNTTVAVLNGTPTAGLAKRVADELVGAGFKQGTVTNASDQARSATIVSFLPGHNTEAKRVRSVLKAGSVQPMDPTTKAIACIAPNPCPSVVVTVGSDRAQ